jgi:mannose-6-phosphate isomerase-like protein (cupin superfamily)
MQSYHDSALDGLFQGQNGWGHIAAPQSFKDEILTVVEDLKSGSPPLEMSARSSPQIPAPAGVMEITNLYKVPAFTTKDGSEIRELLAHRNSAIRNQSLAEARLPVGGATQEHFHAQAEEIYYITHGIGRIRIEEQVRDVVVGDAIAILPGQRHKLWNIGAEPLRLLCCCAPAYEHSDTVVTEENPSQSPPSEPGS